MKLQIQDDHNRSMIMHEDRLTLLADYHTPKTHRHVAAHLVIALSGVMFCTVSGQKMRTRGICIGAEVDHAIDTSMGMLLTILIDPDSALYHMVEDNCLQRKEYAVLSDRLIQGVQVFYRHCGSDVEALDHFVISQIKEVQKQDLQKHNREKASDAHGTLEKMRKFYDQIGRVGSITQASLNAGFPSPSHFAEACLEIFGISVHDLLSGRRGCDVEMEVPEQGNGN